MNHLADSTNQKPRADGHGDRLWDLICYQFPISYQLCAQSNFQRVTDDPKKSIRSRHTNLSRLAIDGLIFVSFTLVISTKKTRLKIWKSKVRITAKTWLTSRWIESNASASASPQLRPGQKNKSLYLIIINTEEGRRWMWTENVFPTPNDVNNIDVSFLFVAVSVFLTYLFDNKHQLYLPRS